MIRLLIWLLLFGLIIGTAWLIVGFDLPKWIVIITLVLGRVLIHLDLKLAGRTLDQPDTVLSGVTGTGDFGLSRGAQISLGIVCLIFTLMMYGWASSSPGDPYRNYSIVAVFGLITGACLLPRAVRGLCGDAIAILILTVLVWMWMTISLSEDGVKAILITLNFGGLSVFYLVVRYRRLLKKNI